MLVELTPNQKEIDRCMAICKKEKLEISLQTDPKWIEETEFIWGQVDKKFKHNYLSIFNLDNINTLNDYISTNLK